MFILHFLFILWLIKTAGVICGRLTGFYSSSDFQAGQNLVTLGPCLPNHVVYFSCKIMRLKLTDSFFLGIGRQIDLETQVLSLQNSCLQREKTGEERCCPPWLYGYVPAVSWLSHRSPHLGCRGSLVSADFSLRPVSANCLGLSEADRNQAILFIYVPKKFFLIHRSTKLVIIERLLLLAERYVITIEVSLSF